MHPAFPIDPPLRMPGAILATRLKVYDTPGPDGQLGGTPHFHLMCTEMYFVLAGSGSVEIMDQAGCSVVELSPYTAYLFSPGTLHRLINPRRDLELFITMQNSGLPERGDNVVTFRADTLADPAAFQRAMHIVSPVDALRRRDEGVEGFLELKAVFEQDAAAGREALAEMYRAAARATQAKRPEWNTVIREGALAEAEISLARGEALDRGDIDYLLHARQHLIAPQAYSKPGFCGTLDRYFDPATLLPEGQARS